MKETTVKNFINNVQKESKTDMLIAACDESGAVSLTMVGDMVRITSALFSSLNDTKSPDVQKELFNIVRNLVYNILRNPSSMSNDLMAMINAVEAESDKEDKNPALIVKMKPDKK